MITATGSYEFCKKKEMELTVHWRDFPLLQARGSSGNREGRTNRIIGAITVTMHRALLMQRCITKPVLFSIQ